MKVARTTYQRLVPSEDTALIDAVIEIGQKREAILVALKAALLRGDNDEALERARELTGLPPYD